MTSSSAPVAVFAYNRPDHLQRTLISLLACEGADDAQITVFIDGPKNEAAAEITDQVYRIASQVLGSRAEIRVSASNKGLSKSIIEGVGELLDRFGSVIVVEDDLSLAPSFLTYMDAALERYREEKNVYQISGHMFEVPEFSDRQEALFLPFTTTWGWATWSRAWEAFDPEATGWEELIRNRDLRRRFDLDGAYPYAWLMERQKRGQSDSWGIRWYWSVFKRGGVSLFPPISLVANTGQDGSGTHGRGVVAEFGDKPRNANALVPGLPSNCSVNQDEFVKVKKAIWTQNGAWKGLIVSKLRQLVRL